MVAPVAAEVRVPSADARRGVNAFQELRRFFANPSDLRHALGWSAPTLRQWTDESPPARPRRTTVQRILDTLAVAESAAVWVSDPTDVGWWLLTRRPELHDRSPSECLDVLGTAAAELLVEQMARIAPSERSSGRAEISIDVLRETLEAIAVRQVRRATPTPAADVDLSDFDNY